MAIQTDKAGDVMATAVNSFSLSCLFVMFVYEYSSY